MSSGTQVELEWTANDGAQGGAGAPADGGANSVGVAPGAYLSDEEILGIDTPGATTPTRRDGIPSARTEDSRRGEARNPSSIDRAENAGARRDSSGKNGPQNDNENIDISARPALSTIPEWMQAIAGDPAHGAEAQRLWQEHQAFRASFSSPDEARAIKELFPGGAPEAQALRQASQAVNQLDAAIYSGDARAQSEVVSELARANPAAFRSLFAEAAKVLAGMGQGLSAIQDGPTLRGNREGWGTRNTSDQQSFSSSMQSGANRNVVRNPSDGFDGVAQSKRDSSGENSPRFTENVHREQNDNRVGAAEQSRGGSHPSAESPITSHQPPPTHSILLLMLRLSGRPTMWLRGTCALR